MTRGVALEMGGGAPVVALAVALAVPGAQGDTAVPVARVVAAVALAGLGVVAGIVATGARVMAETVVATTEGLPVTRVTMTGMIADRVLTIAPSVAGAVTVAAG